MLKPPITQSQKRFQDSLGSLFVTTPTEANVLFLKSSTDIGVQRNGGRNGARLAPQSFLSYFKKLNKNGAWQTKKLSEVEVSSETEELSDFHRSQHLEAKNIQNSLLIEKDFICHLGGGHDHIYPLLKALGESHKKIIVINIDAHADTRTDDEFHSGTPFRQFAREFGGEFHLFQIGLLDFANSSSTLSPLEKGQSQILWRADLKDASKYTAFFNQIKKAASSDAVIVFSLDADALHGSEMPGVSAVNGHGISRDELTTLWKEYLTLTSRPVMGIYELNPVYDTLSMLSVRTLATFVFECLQK